MAAWSITIVTFLSLTSLCLCEDVVRTSPHGDCTEFLLNADSVPAVNSTDPAVQSTIVDWQGIILLIAFGAAAIILALVHRLIRKYIYFDAHLLDTFFDAGGDANVGMVACSVASKWAWTTSYSWAVYSIVKQGTVGQFWVSAGLVVQLLLFSIVACEIRIKAPGAKTFLQVIYARFGSPSHVLVMIFAFTVNIVISSIVMYEGTNILFTLIADVKKEIIAMILSLIIALFTVIGGVGGSLYVAYVACVFIMGSVTLYLVEVFYDPFNRQVEPFGSSDDIYKIIDCLKTSDGAENDADSPVTFLSRGGMIEGVLLIVGGFSSVFLNQSFWQTTAIAKPTQTVWGFILGALVWFAIPFGFAYGLGSAYQVWTVTSGAYPMAEEQELDGLIPVYASQRLLGKTGDFVMLILTAFVVVTTAAGEVLAASSIIIYDIYMTYISPFKSTKSGLSSLPEYNVMTARSKRTIHNEEYMEYDKRCMMLKHVTVVILSLLLIPLTIAYSVINVEAAYVFKLLGKVCGCCVISIALAVTWHRMTGLGVILGAFAGFIGGMVSWLVTASTFDGGIEDFYRNTSRWQPMLAGLVASFGSGGLIGVMCSLCCGGCDSDRVEEEEWEKTRAIDNQILPWAVKYAPEFKDMKLKGIPHFYAVRRIFKFAEISAYIVGVLLAVVIILIWPASMLLEEDWNMDFYGRWTILVVVWVVIALIFITIYPLIAEAVQVCRQSYYNKKWSERSQADTRPLEEDMSQPERAPPAADTQSVKTVESDFQSALGPNSTMGTAARKERWKTFIHLD